MDHNGISGEFSFTSPIGRGRIAVAIRVSDYLKSQVALAYWARASRAFALRRTSSLWARAIRTAILCFPAASNLSRKAARVLSYLAAVPWARKKIGRALARPPRIDRLPCRL